MSSREASHLWSWTEKTGHLGEVNLLHRMASGPHIRGNLLTNSVKKPLGPTRTLWRLC